MTLPDDIVDDEGADAQFVRLLTRYENDLYRYVMSLVGDLSAVDDIVQNVALLLWKKFSLYDPGRPFLPWAFRFAYFEVLKHRKRSRFSHAAFGEELIQQLAADYDQEHDVMKARRKALDGCLQKLSCSDRELVRIRYGTKETIQLAAKRRKLSAFKLYHSLDRIRRDLMVCVNRSMVKEGWDEVS
jgi:RNA polymerase sigma-70 factor (ECF subfamily)